MKKILLVTTLVFLVVVSGFAQTITRSQTNADNAEATLAIEKAKLQWAEGWEKGKPEIIVELFSKNGKQLLNNGKIVKGHAPLLEFYQSVMKGVEKEIKTIKVADSSIKTWLDNENVKDNGNIIISILKIERELLKQSNTSIFGVWQKQKDGTWRIILATGIFQDPLK